MNIPELCGLAKVPVQRSKQPIIEPQNSSDLPEFASIVDEALYLFRANIFFKNFEIKGPADRTLLYALLFIQECLAQVASASPGKSRKELEKLLLISASGSNFPIPGDSKFNLSAIFPNPKNNSETEALRQYLTELRVL
jgi:actin related protein 2/3 complex, subunit 3